MRYRGTGFLIRHPLFSQKKMAGAKTENDEHLRSPRPYILTNSLGLYGCVQEWGESPRWVVSGKGVNCVAPLPPPLN